MAHSDKDNGGSYEPDVFDNPPKGPAGVHRGNRSLSARIAPFIAVVLVAALGGFAAWGVFSGEVNHIPWPWASDSSQSASSDSSSSDSSSKSSDSSSTGTDSSSKDSSSDSSASSDSSDSSGKSASSSDSSATQQDATDQQSSTDAQAQQDAAQQEAQQQAQAQAQAAAQPDKSASVRVVNGTRTSGYAASKKNTLAAAGYTNVVAANPQSSLPSSTVVWYRSDADKATAQDVASTLGISNVQQSTAISASVVVVLMS